MADTGLKANSLGTAGITFMVVSAAAPLTVMAGVAPIALGIGGPGVPLGYLVAGVILIIFAVGFTAMARDLPGSGGFFVYIGHSLGGVVGYASAIVALFSYNALQIGVYGLFAVQVQDTLQHLLGVHINWIVLALVAVVAVWALAYRGIDVGAKVLGVLIVAETAILAVMGVAIVLHGGAHGLSLGGFAPRHLFEPGVLAILGVCFAAFMGFESTALYRSEARDPRRTIPRATYAAVTFMAVFYAFVVWSVVQAYGDQQIQAAAQHSQATLFFDTIGRYVGGWAETAMYLLIVTSVYASQLAFHNAINRYAHALAMVGGLPRGLARTRPGSGSPYVAGTVQSLLAVGVIGLCALLHVKPYPDLLILVNTPGVFGIIGLQFLVAVAAVVYFARRGGSPALVAVSALAALLMAGVIWQFTQHIEVFTGVAGSLDAVLIAVVPVLFVAALLVALLLRRLRPGVIRQIGPGPVPTEPVQLVGVPE